MAGASVAVPRFSRYPSALQRLNLLAQRLPSDDVEALVTKAHSLYASHLKGDAIMPADPVAFPEYEETKPYMETLIASLTREKPIVPNLFAQQLWVVQGYCIGLTLAQENLLVPVGTIEDREGVTMLQALVVSEKPTSVSVSFTSMSAANLLAHAGNDIGSQLARLLLPVLQRWADACFEGTLKQLVDRVNSR